MEIWKDIALITLGLLGGGIAGVIRGDWLGNRAAQGVKELLEVQIKTLRNDQDKLELRLKADLQEFSQGIGADIAQYGERLDAISRRLHDTNNRIVEVLLRIEKK